jgi:DNA-binding IclR family transcriptional regulator
VAHTYHELKEKTVQELRDLAKDIHHDGVKGFSQMNKEHLLPAICKALGIDTHEHAAVVGIDKPATKAQLRALKARCAEALANGDRELLRALRRQRHSLNHQIRAHVARTD